MKSVLLVDTNFSAGPVYKFLVKSGYKVTVVGANRTDALAKSVDDYVCLDYSDVSKMKQLLVERHFDFLVPGCNDLSYSVCAQLNEGDCFPGIDSALVTQTVIDKEKFRLFADRCNLPAPKVLSESEYGERWPVIVKPVDAFSGRGISVVRQANRHEFGDALSNAQVASRSSRVVVEDFVEGQLYSHSAFVQNGHIVMDHVVEEHGSANVFVVDTSCVRNDLPAEVLVQIRADVETISRELGLSDGLIHTQFILKDEQYWLIEITRRCPGDLYSQLIELSTGFAYAENYARPFLGESFALSAPVRSKLVMRHTLTQPFKYTLGSIQFNEAIRILKWVPIASSGEKLRESPYGRIAILFAEASSDEDLQSLMSAALSRSFYVVDT